MLNIRPWRFGWVGLIRACGAAACCVWMAYAPAILIVYAGNGPNSHAWMAQGVRRLLFDPVGDRWIPPTPLQCQWWSFLCDFQWRIRGVALEYRWRSITVASAHNGRFIKVDNLGGLKNVWWPYHGWRKQPYTKMLNI